MKAAANWNYALDFLVIGLVANGAFIRAFRLPKPHLTLFAKYFVTLFVAVVLPLSLGAGSEAWFGYRDQRVHLTELLRVQSQSAADRIETFIEGIHDQLGWTVQFPWTDGRDEQHMIDARRLLRQVPAISAISLVDGSGVEREFVSRLGINRLGKDTDFASNPAVAGARDSVSGVWYGPVNYQRGSEPHITISVAGSRPAAGFAIADVNLKLIWDVVTAIKIGETGEAFVIDDAGRLVAHPDMSSCIAR